MTNLKNDEIQVTIGDSRNLTGKNRGNWNVYERHARKLHCVTLSNTSVIASLNTNLSRVTLELQTCFQAAPEGETLILKKNSTKIHFDKKMANSGGELFLLTTKFY